MMNVRKNHTRPVLLAMTAVLMTVVYLSSGCSKNEDENKNKDGKSGDSSTPKEKVSKNIEALTGNHSKLVWFHYTGETSDAFGNGKQHQLMGIDTRDGEGVRKILEKKSNYSRPLISPDGKWIIYSNKHTERKGKKKYFKPKVHRVDWNGEKGEELGKGFAVDLWKDPETGKTWVYVANLIPSERASMFADKLERFLLDDPEKRELVWKKTKISIDNIQLSDDGKRASCLFPWPDVGVIDLEKGEHWRNQHGCWPSLAPDNSYAAWVFDGSHKALHLFGDRGKKLSVVNINDGPGMGGYEMYHPRWSNHPRFMTVTGPYKGPSIGKSGKNAQVYIGKFSKQLNSVESWVQVTKDKLGDHYPDLWVKGGVKVSLGKIDSSDISVVKPEAGVAKTWPSKPEGLLYLWQSAEAKNQITAGGAQRACKVMARQLARYGRHFELITGGGYFEADPDSSKEVGDQLSKGDIAFQLRLTVRDDAQTGLILSLEGLHLRQQESGELVLQTKGSAYSLGNVKAGEAVHLAASLQQGKWSLFRDGNALDVQTVDVGDGVKPVAEGMLIGDGKWDGVVEGLAMYGRSLSADEVAGDYAFWQSEAKKRKPATRVKLVGKLVAMTEVRSVEELDTYRRALLAYTYEVEKVVEGKYDQKKVLVNHWSIMDRKALSGIPRKLDQSYTLEIELLSEHPELTSERRWSDSFEVMDEYFDVTTPAP